MYDLAREESKETWRDIGQGGETLRIYQSAVLGDSIFLSSESGVMAGSINATCWILRNGKGLKKAY